MCAKFYIKSISFVLKMPFCAVANCETKQQSKLKTFYVNQVKFKIICNKLICIIYCVSYNFTLDFTSIMLHYVWFLKANFFSWSATLKQNLSLKYRICERHFNAEQIITEDGFLINDVWKSIKRNRAVLVQYVIPFRIYNPQVNDRKNA